MGTGGMRLEAVEGERPAGVPASGMALKATHIGQYGPHAAAKNAGFRVGDIIVSFDGKTDFTRETDLLAYSLRTKRPGDKIPITIVRGGKNLELMLTLGE